MWQRWLEVPILPKWWRRVFVSVYDSTLNYITLPNLVRVVIITILFLIVSRQWVEDNKTLVPLCDRRNKSIPWNTRTFSVIPSSTSLVRPSTFFQVLGHLTALLATASLLLIERPTQTTFIYNRHWTTSLLLSRNYSISSGSRIPAYTPCYNSSFQNIST